VTVVSKAQDFAARALAMARRLAALEEGPIRARAAGRQLARLPPEDAARLLAALLERGASGARALSAVGQALLDPRGNLSYEWKASLYAAATALELPQVAALLLAPQPQRAFEEPRDKADPRLAHLTLGHKKALARLRRDPDFMARLAAEGEPAVVRELLRNPLLTEALAVRIAARRPIRPQTLRCLYEDRRWRTRPAVRRALVRNPFVETEIALQIVPTLPAQELFEIAADGSLHPAVRSLAARLAEDRPPG
jgi:DNA-directed RNA polymerase subunit F